jgi:positive regulator of sigma E activity
MKRETGIVTRIEDGIAFVRKPQSQKCENCSGKGSCMFQEHANEVVIKINNTLDAHPGDQISLKISRQPSGLKQLSLFFIAILALLVGGTAGRLCTRFIAGTTGQLLPVVFGLGAVIISSILWRNYYKLQGKQQPQPIMEKIIRSELQDKHGNQANL